MSNLKVAFVFSLAFVFAVAQEDVNQHAAHMNHEHHRVSFFSPRLGTFISDVIAGS